MWIKEQQWPQSLPSSQHSPFSRHEAAHAPNNTSAKLEKLLDEVLSLHEEVSAQRYRARDLRHALRHKRDEEDDLRLALRNKLNLISPENLHQETSAIHKAIEDLQTVTAAYLVLEADYHKVEDELGEREYILEKRMRRMQKTLRRQAPEWPQHSHDDLDSDLSDDSFSTSDADPVSSRTAEYLSYIGEVRMLRERLSELEAEYLSLIDQQQLRERIGISLDSESLGFIARYEGEKAQIEAELSLALHRVQSHPEYKEQSDTEALDRRWRQVLEQYLPEPPEEAPIPDPLRLSEFEDRSSFFESARPKPLNKATFVNRWLLHRLRHSGMEILQFKSQPELLELMDYGWNSDSISQMALMLWFRDETANMAPARSHSGG
ncbi:uncharacterized protein N7459_001468 [Penicillium hispanicum]|uniref:uncharacterized protein n=1 Tax=Penicillium hispanicum TaxID=1080232 RepID=UPI0025405915|nr:uncharacterized protein N7459_001468 [Penicillium hispanicum]KAJ5595260.1 hypothetical protein N7459_001468 [Penicillium hispanicum]